MYEHKTFENILTSLLGYVTEQYPEIDTREGSMIYTALAPAALELETAYHEMDMILDETFVATASLEYLVKHGQQMGVEFNEATCGHFKGEFNVDLQIGSRFNLDKFNYNVINKLSNPTDANQNYVFELVCETAGSEPNEYLGSLSPISYVPNLSHAELTAVIILGEDEEDVESYRYRIQASINTPSSDGNVSQYNEWLNEYDGIGAYKVSPCWNGANTVKLTILNPENKIASEELIADVQKHFDPIDSPGMGMGKAPIGAVVTVDTANAVPVSIDCEVTLAEGYTTPVGVQEAIESYFDSIVFKKSNVTYMGVAAEIHRVDSVDEITKLTITVNGVVMDTKVSPFVDSVTIATDEIAVIDTTTSKINNNEWSV